MNVTGSLSTERSLLRRTFAGNSLEKVIAAFSDPLVRKSAFSIFDQAVVSGTSFFTSVIIGRMCSPKELGIYALALSIVFFARGVQEQIISAPYMIYCNRRRGKELALYAGSSLSHQLIGSIFVLSGLVGLFGFLSLGIGPKGLSPTIWILFSAAPVMLLREYIRHFSFAHLRLSIALSIDLCVAVLQIGGLLWLTYRGMLSVPAVYAVMGSACAVACLGWFIAKAEPLRFHGRRIIADWQHNWKFGKWTLASQLIGSTSPYIMPWILVFAHNESATGVLAACSTLVGLSNMFVIGLSNYLSPKAAQAYASGGVAELRQVLRKTAFMFSVCLGAFCILLSVAGDLLTTWIYGEQFTGSGMIVVVLALGMLANSMSITAGNGLWAMERPSANFRADICVLVVTIIAASVLVYPLGALGAALATFIGTSTGAIVRTRTLSSLMKSKTLIPASC